MILKNKIYNILIERSPIINEKKEKISFFVIKNIKNNNYIKGFLMKPFNSFIADIGFNNLM